MSRVFGAVIAPRGANQPSCGYELAIICLATPPYDHQAKVAATPAHNAISKRERASGPRLRRDGCRFGNHSFSRVIGPIRDGGRQARVAGRAPDRGHLGFPMRGYQSKWLSAQAVGNVVQRIKHCG
jgi:hypothetical protein